MCFKLVHFDTNNTNVELVNLKCVTYTRPIPLLFVLDSLAVPVRASHPVLQYTRNGNAGLVNMDCISFNCHDNLLESVYL